MKDQELNNIPEDITVVAINVFDFHIDADQEYVDQPKKVQGVELTVGKEIAYNLDKGMSRYRLFIESEGMDKKGLSLGLRCRIALEFHFQISSIEKYVREVSGSSKIDIALGYTLMSIAYSTARGILFEKTIGSYFKGIILPVVDPKEMLLSEEDDMDAS